MIAPATSASTLAEAVSEATDRFTEENPESQARFERATQFLPGGDTRTVNHYAPFPVTMVRGEGARLQDLDGHVYLDFLGDYSAGLYGHSDPVIQAALVAAVDRGLTLGPNPDQHELAALMCARFPSVERVRFANSGTEANLMALGLARVVTGREAVMVFEGGYHGSVLNFVGPDRRLNVPSSWILGSYNDSDGARATIADRAGDLAAVLVEPMLGGGGCIPGTVEFLEALREETERRGVLLIFDEVQTSRLGPGGLQEALGIYADLTTFGKYLGGGASAGAFGGRADLMDHFDPRRADHLTHAGTHNNNVLSMAAGVAGLRDVYTPRAARELTARGDALRGRLNEIAADSGAPAQVTGSGSIMNAHFQRTPISRAEDAAATPPAARDLFHLEMMLAGFYVSRRGFMTVTLAHDDEDCDAFARAFAGFLTKHGPALDAQTTA